MVERAKLQKLANSSRRWSDILTCKYLNIQFVIARKWRIVFVPCKLCSMHFGGLSGSRHNITESLSTLGHSIHRTARCIAYKRTDLIQSFSKLFQKKSL